MIEARYLDIDGALGFVEIVTPAGEHAPDALPTVLCIHTAGQSGVQWRHVAHDLAARGYRVLVPDLPGHGRSEPAPDGPVTSLTTYGDWLTALLDALDVHRPYVLGCSIGGKLTLELATRPDRPLAGAVAMEAEAAPAASTSRVCAANSRTSPGRRAPNAPIWAPSPPSGVRYPPRRRTGSPSCTSGRTRRSRRPTSSAGAPTTCATGCRC
ncbi:alpha/beta fold hydrolase [Rhodococcus aetherivorans]